MTRHTPLLVTALVAPALVGAILVASCALMLMFGSTP
jgi:hypothetical protein